MRIIGTISKWNDDRGFGFVTPNLKSEEIFVHISAFPRDGVRPTIGETISFELTVREGKQRAINIQRPQSRNSLRVNKSRPTESQKPNSTLITWLIVLVIVIMLANYGYSHFKNRIAITESTATKSSLMQTDTPKSSSYSCDGRTHCSDMRSYDEAKYFLANCPNTKMDGDGDGEPCESQFNSF